MTRAVAGGGLWVAPGHRARAENAAAADGAPGHGCVLDVVGVADRAQVPLVLLLEPARLRALRTTGEPPATDLASGVRCALQICAGGRFHLAEAPLADGAAPRAGDEELDRIAAEALRVFAWEDLVPELRGADLAVVADLLERLAGELLERGRRDSGYALGARARRLRAGTDRGVDDVPRAREPIASPPAAGFLRPVRERPEVSLIVPTCGRPELLRRALTSVAALSDVDLEVVVVQDGGADDDLRAALDGPLQALGTERVTRIRHGRNRGLAAARNTGLRQARGRYVAFLDDDDRLLPGHFDVLLPVLREGARVAIADARRVLEAPDAPLPRTVAFGGIWQAPYDPLQFRIDNQYPVQAWLCERRLLDEAGGFDESLPLLEDWDLWLRVLERSDPVRVGRVTSEVRVRTDRSNMSDAQRAPWAETQAWIYGKTLRFERACPALRRARLERILARVEAGGEAFPRASVTWLEGDEELFAIDPDEPRKPLAEAGRP